jgi:hypothetical protein
MANYWNKTITVFNKFEDKFSGNTFWHKHVLTNCFYKRTNQSVTVGNVKLQSDENIVRIPYQTNFKQAYEWQNLPTDTQSNYLTLQTGDLIFYDEIADTIDENTSGMRSNDIIKKYKSLGVMTIKAVNINDDLPNKHYLVRGE